MLDARGVLDPGGGLRELRDPGAQPGRAGDRDLVRSRRHRDLEPLDGGERVGEEGAAVDGEPDRSGVVRIARDEHVEQRGAAGIDRRGQRGHLAGAAGREARQVAGLPRARRRQRDRARLDEPAAGRRRIDVRIAERRRDQRPLAGAPLGARGARDRRIERARAGRDVGGGERPVADPLERRRARQEVDQLGDQGRGRRAAHGLVERAHVVGALEPARELEDERPHLGAGGRGQGAERGEQRLAVARLAAGGEPRQVEQRRQRARRPGLRRRAARAQRDEVAHEVRAVGEVAVERGACDGGKIVDVAVAGERLAEAGAAACGGDAHGERAAADGELVDVRPGEQRHRDRDPIAEVVALGGAQRLARREGGRRLGGRRRGRVAGGDRAPAEAAPLGGDGDGHRRRLGRVAAAVIGGSTARASTRSTPGPTRVSFHGPAPETRGTAAAPARADRRP